MASPRIIPIQRTDSPRPRAKGSLVAEVFRPKFPLDPFTQLHTIREPWMLSLDNLVAATNEVRRDVVLVLGAPALRDINPILHSPQLACSLLIIASHKPPAIHTPTRPAICTIRLNAPLAIESSGAVRLVTLLACAERVARLWRNDGGPGVLREIRENETGLHTSMVPSNLFRIPGSATTSPSPLSSSEVLKPSSSLVSSSRSSLSGSHLRKSLSNSSSADPLQRPFDVVLNFLPPHLHDKAMLKQTILVTTITRTYLVAACPASSIQFSPKPVQVRRRSFLRRSSLYDPPSTPTVGSRDSFSSSPDYFGSPASAPLAKSHLVHILPLSENAYTAQEKLIHNIESFQLSFSQPASMNMGKQDILERATAYIVPAAALRESVRFGPPQAPSTSENPPIFAEWTVADIVLSGILDPLTNASQVPHSGPRAWIGSAGDFAFIPEIESRSDSSSSSGPTTPASSLHVRERRRDGSIHWKPMQLLDDHDANFHAQLPPARPPPVPPKILRRPVPRSPAGVFSPASSSEDSALESDSGRRQTIVATVNRRSVAIDETSSPATGKRMHWRFWNSRQRIATQ